jgi:hypothetical protein
MQPGFMDIVKDTWESQVQASNSATRIAAKFKNLRRTLKKWSKGICKLSNLIQVCNETILVLDKLEEQRQLHPTKWIFRGIVKEQIKKLLRCKNEYWRQIYTIRWVQLGDETTKFFHATAIESNRYRKNTISILQIEDGREISFLAEKVASLWNTFKGRMRNSKNPTINFNLEEFNFPSTSLEHLAGPFIKEEIDQVIK